MSWCLDIINIHSLSILSILVLALAPILVELEIAVSIALLSIRICLVDLRALRQLSIRLQRSRLVSAVLQDDIALLVLVVAQGEEDDIALVDPDFLSKFATDVSEALGTVKAEGFQTSVSEHLEDLRVFC